MTLETKFDIGQVVYFLDRMAGKLDCKPVTEIIATATNSGHGPGRLYVLGGHDYGRGAVPLADRLKNAVGESKLFATKEELLASL